jgi:hypothetical protein
VTEKGSRRVEARITEVCAECGRRGEVPHEVVPYAFKSGADRVWLCWAGAGPCFLNVWRKFCESAKAS